MLLVHYSLGQPQHINNIADFPFLMTVFTATFIYYLEQLHYYSSVFIIIQHNNYESLKKSKFKAYDSNLRNCSVQKVDLL